MKYYNKVIKVLFIHLFFLFFYCITIVIYNILHIVIQITLLRSCSMYQSSNIDFEYSCKKLTTAIVEIGCKRSIWYAVVLYDFRITILLRVERRKCVQRAIDDIFILFLKIIDFLDKTRRERAQIVEMTRNAAISNGEGKKIRSQLVIADPGVSIPVRYKSSVWCQWYCNTKIYNKREIFKQYPLVL